MDRQNWVETNGKIGQLCELHDEAIGNYEKCREFASGMSLFLSEMEDSGCQSIANKAMDALLFCNPKVASHCDKANMEKNLLEQMRAEIEKKLTEYK